LNEPVLTSSPRYWPQSCNGWLVQLSGNIRPAINAESPGLDADMTSYRSNSDRDESKAYLIYGYYEIVIR